ncbi:MAG: O-antigen ligase family protein [Dehalococcoidia bacterium]|jgi:O-antigen ligase|nr:O-antigen ligase family protein [Dehalococcoidia bacterium]
MTAVTARSRARAASRSRRNADLLGGVVSGASVRAWTGRGIEAAWLVAAIVTPLIILSESAFLSKTELPKVATVRLSAGIVFLLLLAEAGLAVWQRGFTVPRHPVTPLRSALSRVISGVRGDNGTRVLIAAGGVLATTALASVFALVPRSSTWGVDPGNESNSLYSTLAYAVLFFAVATRLRTPSRVRRLLGAMVIAGTLAALVGIAQHLGHAPLGIRSTSGSARVSGTAGNPIFFATILVVTMTLAIGTSLSIRELSRRTIGWLSLHGLVIAIHITALLVTLSRGPWLGAAAGLVAIAALAPMLFGWRRTAVTGLVAGIALLVSLAFLAATSGASSPRLEGVDAAPARGIERISVGDIQGRTTTLTGVFDPINNPRIARWDGALDLALNRPEPPEGAQPGFLVRSLFGYGPDAFPDVFTMVAPTRMSGVRTTAAHNDPLNRLVETGLAGLLAWTALWSSLGFLLLRNLWMHRRNAGPGQIVILAIGAALTAWFVAGLTGIPKSGDTVLVWLLMGLAVATPFIFDTAEARTPTPAPSTPRASVTVRAAAVAAAGLIALATVWITWTETVQRLSADASAASAVSSDADKSSVSGRLNDLDRAIALAPDQPRYHTIRSEIFGRIAAESGTPDSASAMREAAASAERALALNPLDRALNFQAAFLNWELAKLGDVDAAMRTYALYERLMVLTPQHQSVGSRLAAVGEVLGLTP